MQEVEHSSEENRIMKKTRARWEDGYDMTIRGQGFVIENAAQKRYEESTVRRPYGKYDGSKMQKSVPWRCRGLGGVRGGVVRRPGGWGGQGHRPWNSGRGDGNGRRRRANQLSLDDFSRLLIHELLF